MFVISFGCDGWSSFFFDDGVDLVLLEDLHDGVVAIGRRHGLEIAVRGLSVLPQFLAIEDVMQILIQLPMRVGGDIDSAL